MAGYSGTPLPKKLGIKEGHRLALLEAPASFERTLGPLPEDVKRSVRLSKTVTHDVIVLFVRSLAELKERFGQSAQALDPAGGLWIAWPKKASKVPTDVTEDRVRELALSYGLVDNKVCAIDEVWSGLRCVVRLRDRPAVAAQRKGR